MTGPQVGDAAPGPAPVSGRARGPAPLSVSGLAVRYGPVDAVFSADLDSEAGEIVALLGHNGAGKTTTLRAVAGLVSPHRGMVEVDGADVTRVSSARRVDQGIVYVPEDRFVFGDLSVADNLRIGSYRVPPPDRCSFDEATERFPVLRERLGQRAGSLSGGERRMLSLAMATMARPRLLLLDEPSLGLAPLLVDAIMDSIVAMAAEEGVTVVLVEQNVEQALRVANRVVVMRAGRTEAPVAAAALAEQESWWDLF